MYVHKWYHGKLSRKKLSPEQLSRKNCRLYYFGEKLLREKMSRKKLSPTANCLLQQIVARP
jgi:hypothetical protein